MRQPLILITGAQGRVGRRTAMALVGRARLRLFDRTPPTFSVAGADTICGDLRVLDHLLDAASECDAIIHLGAIPGNSLRPDRVIETNVRGTFNVTFAAEYQRVRRIVFVSSEMTLGCFASHGRIRPDYLPVDEDHPLRAVDPYGLSKKMCEELLDVFRRRTGGDAVAIRPGFVLVPEMVGRVAKWYGIMPPRWRGSLFVYTHVDDLAEGIRDLALADRVESSAFWMTAPDNSLGIPTETICREFFGDDVRVDLAAMPGNAALVRCDRARDVMGWNPTRRIRPLVEEYRAAHGERREAVR